jgi:hypothetical protein
VPAKGVVSLETKPSHASDTHTSLCNFLKMENRNTCVFIGFQDWLSLVKNRWRCKLFDLPFERA